MGKRLARLLFAAVLLSTAMAVLGPSSALAADCPNNSATSWNSASSGSWDDAANWNNGVPTGSCDVSITFAGSYTVTMPNGGAAKSISLGGLSGTQTLQIAGTTVAGNPQNSVLSIGAGNLTIGTHGVLQYMTSGSNPGEATTTNAGTIINSGLVRTDGAAAGTRDIQNNVTNNAGGTIAFHTNTITCGCGGTHHWDNHGTITTDLGTASSFTGTAGGVVMTQDGGTFTNNGHAVVAGMYTRTGGTTTGNPVEVCGVLNTPGAGTASFEFDPQPSLGCGGGEIDDDVGASTSVLIDNTSTTNNLQVNTSQDFTNNGTIKLDGVANSMQDVLIGGHTLTNSSTGSILLAQPGSSQLQMKLVNHGNVHVTGGSTAVSGVSSNDATMTVDASTQLVVNNNFTDTGGTISNAGLFRVGGTFTHTGGNATGTAINLCGATLHAPGPGTASFELDNIPGTCSGGAIDGDIGSGDSLRIHNDQTGDHAIGTSVNFTNAGTITLDGTGGGANGRDIIVGGHLITNTGTIQASQPNISSQFQTPLTNNGTVNVAAGAAFNTTGAVIQSGGTFNVAAGGQFGTNQLVTLSGGTIANSGSWDSQDFTHSGGSATGNPIHICGGSLSPTGPGTASFQFGGTCTHGGIASDIGSGDNVTFVAPSGTNDIFDSAFTNHGTITFAGGPANGQTQLHGSGTITNASDGTISFAHPNSGTSDNVASPIVNNGTLTIAAGSATGISTLTLAGGTTTVDGSIGGLTSALAITGGTLRGTGSITDANGVNNTGGTVHPGHSPGTLSIDGPYTQASGGTLAIDVDGADHSKLAVTGAASIAGTLAVTTATPQTGTFPVLTASGVTGTFAPVTFAGQTDSVSYGPTSVSLSGTAPPTNSAAPAVSGATTVGSTLTSTQGDWTGSPSGYAYQWRDCDAAGAACTDVPGATGTSYVLTRADGGHTIRVAVTATNDGGSTTAVSAQTTVVSAPGGGGGGGDTKAPVISAAAASPKTFAVDGSGTGEAAVASRARRGTALKYTLSERARVVFTIEAVSSGRKSGRRCVRATKKNRKAKRCTRFVRTGRFAVASTAGSNSHHFTGRIGSRRLKPGNYRVTLVATDAAKNSSKPKSLKIKVVAK